MRTWWGWRADEDRLTPTEYRYELPPEEPDEPPDAEPPKPPVPSGNHPRLIRSPSAPRPDGRH